MRRFPLLSAAIRSTAIVSTAIGPATILAACLLAGLLPRAARADEGSGPPPKHAGGEADTDHVSRLTAEELAFLKKRIRGWDDLDPRRRQAIARNVLRIRRMNPEERKRFEARLEQMRRRGGRWADFRRRGTHMLVNRGLAHAARAHLGRAFERRLRRADVSDHVFEMAFARTFWGELSGNAFVDGEPVAPDALPDHASPRLAERYARTHAEYTGLEDPRRRRHLKRRLGYLYASMEGEQLRQRLARSSIQDSEAYVAAVAERVRRLWPEAFEASVADPDALLAAAEQEEMRRSLRRLMRRDGALAREEAALFVRLLERWAVHAEPEGADAQAAGEAADAVLDRVLRGTLEVEADALEERPPRSDPVARAAWYRRVLHRRLGGRAGGPRGSGHRAAGGLRLPRPEGISDEDWRIWQEAVAKVRRDGMPRGRPRRPEAMSEAGWARIREAMRAHLKSLRRRGPR